MATLVHHVLVFIGVLIAGTLATSLHAHDQTKPTENTILRGLSILVLGGNGFMGAETVVALHDAGAKVTILNRGSSYWDAKSRILARPGVRWLEHDRDGEDTSILSKLDSTYDILLDFSGTNERRVERAVKRFASRVQALWVYISSDSVYEVCGDGPTTPSKSPEKGLNEEEAIRSQNELLRARFSDWDQYGHDKLAGEEVLQASLPPLSLPFVMLRLPDVVGPRDTTSRSFATSLYLRIVTDVENGLRNEYQWDAITRKVSFVYSKDVSALCVALATRVTRVRSSRSALQKTYPGMVNRAFNVAFKETIMYTNILTLWSPDRLANMLPSVNIHKVASTDKEVPPTDSSQEAVSVVFEDVYPSTTRGPLDVTAVLNEFKGDWSPTPIRTALLDIDQFYMTCISDYILKGTKTHEKEILEALEHLAFVLGLDSSDNLHIDNVLQWFRIHLKRDSNTKLLHVDTVINDAAVSLQQESHDAQTFVAAFEEIESLGAECVLNGIPCAFVETFETKDLTKAEFLKRYFDTNTPVIIKNATAHWEALHVDIQSTIGSMCVGRGGVKTFNRTNQLEGSAAWGGLEDVPRARDWYMEDYVKYMHEREIFLHTNATTQNAAMDPHTSFYMPDIDLPRRCPSIVEKMTVLPYWNDYRQTQSLYAYFGGRGTGTGMHQDNDGIYFWMAVLSGKKEIALFSPSEAEKLLRTDKPVALKSVCSKDGFCPGLSGQDLPDIFDVSVHHRHANLKSAKLYLASLRPGDVFFGPASFFHQARNVEPFSFGVTGNFMLERKTSAKQMSRNMCFQIAQSIQRDPTPLLSDIEACLKETPSGKKHSDYTYWLRRMANITEKSQLAWEQDSRDIPMKEFFEAQNEFISMEEDWAPRRKE